MASVVVGTLSGVLSFIAVSLIALYSSAFWFLCIYSETVYLSHRALRFFLTGIVSIAAVLFGVHAFPGFSNPLIVRNVILSDGAEPFSMYINFDKTAAGLLLLGFCYHGYLSNRKQLFQALRSAAPVIFGSIIVLIAISFAVGYLRFAPKIPFFALIWVINNLFFVTLSEEAFFRGFLMKGLDRTLSGVPNQPTIALFLSAFAFGLAHAGGGLAYVCISTLAGIGYGLAYQRSGRIEMAILTHFAVNITHFFLFTYPRSI